MDIILKKGTARQNRVEAISSKSYVHRLLIAASLCDRPVSVRTNIVSKDMEATMNAVKKIKEAGPNIIDCNESGSTARFILPLAALLSPGSTLTGSGKLPERPMGPLCDVLKSAGVDVSDDHLPITVNGKPHAGIYEIAGNVSSQFISGLLFMLPLLEGDSHLVIKGDLESAAYVDMTTDVLSRFGIRIRKTEDGFDIPGSQRYEYMEEGTEIAAEGDWSNGAYLMTIGTLGCGRVFDCLTVTGLDPASIQGDREVIDIFKQFGITVNVDSSPTEKGADITVTGAPEHPVNIQCSQIPDLVPALAVIAAFTEGDSIFGNIGRLRMKECDRVEAVKSMLNAIGVEVDITRDGDIENMTVHGRRRESFSGLSSDEPVRVDSCNDHRIAMAAAAIAFAVDRPVLIKDAMAVDKSYPGFYEVIEKLGMDHEGV